MSTISLASVVVKSPDQVSTNLGNETVILGLTSEEYYSLKEVGARIWEIIEEPKTVRQILETLLNEYAVEPERCERDLLAILQELANEGLVEIKNEATR
jgi:hypothetical protein